MRKVLIIGNSAAGKSTLAHYLAASERLAYLDLDTVAWLPQLPPKRMPLDESMDLITGFVKNHQAWVIEGCYTDLAGLISEEANELIFLNVPVDHCLENADMRPFEPHKYSSPQAQDKNLPMLRDWIRDYANRQDDCSLAAHRQLFDRFNGKKTELTQRPELEMPSQHQAVF
ncbi:MAG: shikimate kinase [Cellvibrionaceae bacterium]|nr:shikimate kinase [Cellvibrionaceae bacterium]MCV6628166.1 shikimate kinase [Cellvibrionaceae bacterium]